MPSTPRRSALASLALTLLVGGVSPAAVRADDPSCKPVIEALVMQAKVSYRGTITARGRAAGEEIYTATAIYRGKDGRWTKIPATPQQRLDANREVGASLSGCKALREETVDGQAATVYAAHSETVSPPSNSEMLLWIGKSSRLPLKVDSETRMFGSRLHISKLYRYGEVKPPAGVR